MKEGQHFGELALAEKNKVRAARMMCSKNCSLLVLTREQYRKVLEKIIQKSKAKINEFLSDLGFLDTWSSTRLLQL